MNIQAEYSLKTLNTFGINATAQWYISYDSVEALQRLISDEYFQECRCLPIGEGSNLLFLTNFRGIVLRSEIRELTCLSEDDSSVTLSVGAGLLWDDFVAYCTEQGYYGAENLSLIPGQVGAAAVQNIGAYGVEIERLVVGVEAVHRRSGESRHFAHSACQYRYRHSIFKDPDYADWIITHVVLRLSKVPQLNLSYADLQRYFEERGVEPTLEGVRAAVIAIRESKLPDYKTLGNAGSFFMNPVVDTSKADALKRLYPEMPCYPQAEGGVKLAAGWLIEQCGYKGYREGDAGVYERQALILVNHGTATGTDIASLAETIRDKVRTVFGVELTPEVRYIS